jgi:hypothetical protein
LRGENKENKIEKINRENKRKRKKKTRNNCQETITARLLLQWHCILAILMVLGLQVRELHCTISLIRTATGMGLLIGCPETE